jgi:hypothetical protein
VTRPKDVQQNYEWTVGGPVAKDRLWFFASGRWQEASPGTAPRNGYPLLHRDVEQARRIKLTGTVSPNHTVQGSYLNNRTTSASGAGRRHDRAAAWSTGEPEQPVGHVCAACRGHHAAAQVSGRRFGFGTVAALKPTSCARRSHAWRVRVPAGRFYNAPYLDSTDPEDRNNRQATGSLNWLLTSRAAGSHDVKAGFENFASRYVGGNSQTATGYVFRADYATAAGRPALDSQGRVVPVFQPGVTRLEQWLPSRGAILEIVTNSLYVHDRWTAGPRLTLDLGTRFEMVNSDDWTSRRWIRARSCRAWAPPTTCRAAAAGWRRPAMATTPATTRCPPSRTTPTWATRAS